MSILAFAGVLILLVIAHELGHFITAKLSGVVVQEFGLGFPPRLFAIKWRGTEYSLNALPIGGFVKMLGEEDPSEPGSLASKSIPIRLVVLAAGATMNALLPIVLFSISFMVPQQVAVGQVEVQKVQPGSPAELAGVQPGDRILEINDRRIQNSRDLAYNIQLNLGSPTTLLVETQGQRHPVRLVPRWNPPEGEGATGMLIDMANPQVVLQAYPFWEAVPLGVRTSFDTFTLAKNEITGWFVRGQAPRIAGPIGIAQMTGEVVRFGWVPLLEFTALISMNFAVINILPLPALDGGRIFFVLIEAVRRGKRIPPEREGFVHLVGFVLLLALMAIISYFDIMRIIRGEDLFR